MLFLTIWFVISGLGAVIAGLWDENDYLFRGALALTVILGFIITWGKM